MRLTGVTAGAAVVSILTADRLRNSDRVNAISSVSVRAVSISAYLRQRAAAPFVALVHEAAGRVSGAACLAVAHVPGRTGNSPAGLLLQGRDLLQPGEAEAAGLVTRLLGHVTFVAFGAAVLVIAAAHSLETFNRS